MADAMPAVDGFVDHLGLRISSDEGTVRGTLDITPELLQPYGIVHGGVYCSIVETLASYAAALRTSEDGAVVVGVSNSTDFLRATRAGTLDAVAEPIHVGRSQHLWQVRIWRRADQKPVARGQVRLQVLPGDGELAGGPASGGP